MQPRVLALMNDKLLNDAFDRVAADLSAHHRLDAQLMPPSAAERRFRYARARVRVGGCLSDLTSDRMVALDTPTCGRLNLIARGFIRSRWGCQMKRKFALALGFMLLNVSGSCTELEEPVPDAATTYSGDGVCGNGKVEGDELCDKTDLNKETCKTLGDGLYSGGSLRCSSKCTFDVSMCVGNDSGTDDMDSGSGGTGG